MHGLVRNWSCFSRFATHPVYLLIVRPSLPVLGFCLGSSLLTGFIFGAVPAWLSSRADPIESLRGGQSIIAKECGSSTKDVAHPASGALCYVDRRSRKC